ncbi:AimR family lysis-lysogeny pheromone receptor [Paraliobacillus ryukyuensis]|uniref:AimR family lysis-lysogeny pheromone receptor n=1 Tax=Paraliobacillus ryukyuensis TaxID=200904 RepID=UPI00117CFB8B|nr:AimR family lysis-lysogeny pheromone receptor [Paraliobacillus ryukyuensis]
MIRQQLLNTMEVKGYTYNHISKQINCSEGIIHKFLTSNESIRFDIVLSLVKFLDPEKEIELLREYCQSITKPSHILVALEYMAINHQFDSAREIVERSKSFKNQDVKEATEVYSVFLDWKQGFISALDMYLAIEDLKINKSEFKVFLKIMEMYYFYIEKNFRATDSICLLLSKKINEIEGSNLFQYYKARFLQIKSHVELRYKMDIEKSREICSEIISLNISNSFLGFAYNSIALSYMDESLEKMNLYKNKAIEYFKIVGEQNVKGIASRFDKINAIKKNKINQIFICDEKDYLDVYINGIIKGDKERILESFTRFVNDGDYFLAKIPEQKLIEHYSSNRLIEAIKKAN